MIFCHSIYVKKVMKLLAFIFEQPSYMVNVMKFETFFSFSFQIKCWFAGLEVKKCLSEFGSALFV